MSNCFKCPYFHGSDPHTQRLGGGRHSTDDVRLEVRLRTVLSDLLQDTVTDVILVKVHQLLDKVRFTWMNEMKLRLKTCAGIYLLFQIHTGILF